MWASRVHAGFWYLAIRSRRRACPTPDADEGGDEGIADLTGDKLLREPCTGGDLGISETFAAGGLRPGFTKDAALGRYGFAIVLLIIGSEAEGWNTGDTFDLSGLLGPLPDCGVIRGWEADAGRPGILKKGAVAGARGKFSAIVGSPGPRSHRAVTDVTIPPLPPLADRTS